MSLYANTRTVAATREAFPTAQHYRDLLSAHGFIPLTKINDGEHWVRGARRVILDYHGDCPGEVEAHGLTYAQPTAVGDDWILDLA